MATEGPQLKLTGVTASADLSAKQYYFVKSSGNNTVTVCAAVTDIPVGVLQNSPTSGQAAEVVFMGISKVSGDADLAAGNVIGTSADGQAAAYVAGTDTTKYSAGICIKDNGAAAGIIKAVINCGSPNRLS